MPIRKFGGAELIKAVIARLAADSLTGDYSVYDYIPDDASLPYIRISIPMGTKSSKFGSRDYEAEENMLVIDIWSDYLGDKEAADMMNNTVQALTGSTPLSITGYTTPPQVLLEYSELVVDDSEPGVIVRHGIQRYAIHMTPTS